MQYYTIEKEYTIEYEVKKSLFICTIMPISSIKDCQEKLKNIRKKYYDATHNCYSYILNENGTNIIKNSDDGEPSQTAGIVIYNVLMKNNLQNILCVVTRYFGGIKLGANGLVRAYSKAASDVILQIEKKKIEKMVLLSFTCDYNYINDVLKICANYKEESKQFDTKVTFNYYLPCELVDEIKQKLIEITKNNIEIKEH